MNLKTVKVALLGYYGNANVGDEALLQSVLTHFSNDNSAIFDLLVLSSNPELTKKQHKVNAVKNYIPTSWKDGLIGLLGRNRVNYIKSNWQALSCDILVIGGGGLFFDRPDNCRDFLRFINIIRLFQMLGKDVYFLGVSSVELYHDTSKQALRKMAVNQHLRLVVCRDNVSSKLFIDAGASKKIVHTTEDLVFTLSADSSAECHLISKKPNNSKLVAIAPCGHQLMDNDDYADILIDFITQLASQGITVYLIALSTVNDRDAVGIEAKLSQVLSNPNVSLIDKSLSVNEYMVFFSKMNCVVAERLHASILSAVIGAPFIGISYAEKVTLLYERLERKCYCQNNNDLTVEWLLDNVNYMIKNRQSESEKIIKMSKKLSQNAQKSFVLFDEVFGAAE